MTADDAGQGPVLSEGLGALPEPGVTTLCDYIDAAGQRHSLAYSVDAVRAMLAAERERCARIVETQDANGDPVGGWFELLAAKIRA